MSFLKKAFDLAMISLSEAKFFSAEPILQIWKQVKVTGALDMDNMVVEGVNIFLEEHFLPDQMWSFSFKL